MTDKTYNGWTNYETWRVNLEMIDGDDHASENDFDAYTLGQHLREMVEGVVSEQAEGLALDYALAFLDAVNWREIAQSQIDAYRVEETEEENA